LVPCLRDKSAPLFFFVFYSHCTPFLLFPIRTGIRVILCRLFGSLASRQVLVHFFVFYALPPRFFDHCYKVSSSISFFFPLPSPSYFYRFILRFCSDCVFFLRGSPFSYSFFTLRQQLPWFLYSFTLAPGWNDLMGFPFVPDFFRYVLSANGFQRPFSVENPSPLFLTCKPVQPDLVTFTTLSEASPLFFQTSRS